MIPALLGIVDLLIQVVSLIFLVWVVLSWLVAFNVVNTHNEFVRQLANALDRITEPLCRPIRRILPDFGGLDFSPLVVILLLQVLQKLVRGMALQYGGMV